MQSLHRRRNRRVCRGRRLATSWGSPWTLALGFAADAADSCPQGAGEHLRWAAKSWCRRVCGGLGDPGGIRTSDQRPVLGAGPDRGASGQKTDLAFRADPARLDFTPHYVWVCFVPSAGRDAPPPSAGRQVTDRVSRTPSTWSVSNGRQGMQSVSILRRARLQTGISRWTPAAPRVPAAAPQPSAGGRCGGAAYGGSSRRQQRCRGWGLPRPSRHSQRAGAGGGPRCSPHRARHRPRRSRSRIPDTPSHGSRWTWPALGDRVHSG